MAMKRWAKQTGFTIVELLIVIVVIAILAAITIVAYNGIQQRAKEAEILTDLSYFSKKIELDQIDRGRYYTSNNELKSIKLRASNPGPGANNVMGCWDSTGSGYAIFMRDSFGRYYRVSKEAGPVKVTLANWSSAACATTPYASQEWGEFWLSNYV